MEIILHAGFYKTATTTLQSVIFLNRDAFIKHKIFVPRLLSKKNFAAKFNFNRAHHILFHQFNKALRNTDQLLALKRSIDSITNQAKDLGCEKIFFSSELFSRLTINDIHFLEERVFCQKITLIYTLRNISEIKEALNNQTIKRKAQYQFNPGIILKSISEILKERGNENMHIFYFQKDKIEMFIASFLDYLKVRININEALKICAEYDASNSSISWEEYWLLRELVPKKFHFNTAKSSRDKKQLVPLFESIAHYRRNLTKTKLVTMSLTEHEEMAALNLPYYKTIKHFYPDLPASLLLQDSDLQYFYQKNYGAKNIDVRPDNAWMHAELKQFELYEKKPGRHTFMLCYDTLKAFRYKLRQASRWLACE